MPYRNYYRELEQRYLDAVDPGRELPEGERLRRAEAAKRADYLRRALKASRTRQAG